MGEFRMPSLGADMEAGTVLEWKVEPGDPVHRGDIVAVVDTDKADVEVEIFENGVVEELLVAPGEKVAIGTPLARIGAPGAAAGSPPTQPPAPVAEPAPAHPATPTRAAVPPAPSPAEPEVPAPTRWRAPGAARVSPVVRRLAARLGVDVATVPGTGPGGGITRADVERAATAASSVSEASAGAERARVSPRARRLASERGVDVETLAGSGPSGAVVGTDVEAAGGGPPRAAPPSAPAVAPRSDSADRARAMRTAIAGLMARSKREIPHYYLASDIDFSSAQAFLAARNEARAVTERVLPAALLLKATALGVREVPELNGFWVDDELHPSDSVHIGVAVSLREGGLIAPAIHDADTLGLDELMAALRDLVNRARSGNLRATEMSDPTVTVTNLGEQGVRAVYGVIYPPQVALVGFGSITERPFAIEGMVGAHPVVTATLAADHRATDGARGARLLNVIDRVLQEPESL